MSECAYGDETCPCQDGDPCHYVDLPGSPAMVPPPRSLMDTPAVASVRARSLDEHGQPVGPWVDL